MADSILDTIKKPLGLPPEVIDFDDDLILFINSSFSKLNQLGVGAAAGFEITDRETTWDQFVKDIRFNDIKTFIVLDVRLVFDPPTIGVVNGALKEQLNEVTWRISERREEDEWTRKWPSALS